MKIILYHYKKDGLCRSFDDELLFKQEFANLADTLDVITTKFPEAEILPEGQRCPIQYLSIVQQEGNACEILSFYSL